MARFGTDETVGKQLLNKGFKMKLFKSPNIKQELLKLNSLFNSRRGKRKGNQTAKNLITHLKPCLTLC
jgi:hypothetical protein